VSTATSLSKDTASLLGAALEYLNARLPVFPVCSPTSSTRCLEHGPDKHGPDGIGKTPLVAWKPYQDRLPTEHEVRKWWGLWPRANIGFATGALSGIVVIDLDDEEAIAEAERLGGIDDGPWVTTGRVGGRHRYCAYRDDEPRDFAKAHGIDYRGEGGYAILPPSRHRAGPTYTWRVPLHAVELPPLPEWVNELKAEKRQNGTAPTIGEVIASGERNSTLTSLAGTMRRRAMSKKAIGAALLIENADRCKPPLDDDEVWMIANSVARYEPDLESTDPVKEWPKPEDRGEAVLSELGGIEYVEDVISPGRILVVAAEEGSGKSIAIDDELGIRVAVAGGSFAGTWPVLQNGSVLVLSEMHPDDDYTRERMVLESLELTRDALKGRYFRLPLMTAALGKPCLRVPEWRDWAVEWSRAHGVLLHVYDTATGATDVDPWGREIQAVFRDLRLMLDAYPELAIVLIVHCKKPQGHGERRISDVLGEWARWCDVVLMLERDGPTRAKLTTFKRVRHQRRIVATQQAGLLVDPRDISEGSGPKVPLEKVVLTVRANPGLTIADLATQLKVGKATAGRYAKAAIDAGHVHQEISANRGAAVLFCDWEADSTASPHQTASHDGDAVGDAQGPNDRITASPPYIGDAVGEAVHGPVCQGCGGHLETGQDGLCRECWAEVAA
jgi:hypothetical protein